MVEWLGLREEWPSIISFLGFVCECSKKVVRLARRVKSGDLDCIKGLNWLQLLGFPLI